ncbi:uncharacterized protein [Ptychodera flava]|uniref:uncharacterized protein isoform X2 n=1 Tax=Ptychodera flava TaxID=63121 RepID=UPI00396A366A
MKNAVVLVAETWNRAGNAIAALNCQLAVSLAKERQLQTYCVVLQATAEQINDAAKHCVELIVPKLADGLLDDHEKEQALNSSIKWLLSPENYFTTLPQLQNVGAIIVHCPGTYRATFAIKRLFPQAKVILINHAVTRPDNESSHLKNVERIDFAFSVGPKVFNHYEKVYRAKPIKHELYLPRPDQAYFDLKIDVSTLTEKKNKQVLMNAVSDEKEDASNKAITAALDKASELFEKMNVEVIVLCVRRSAELNANQLKESLIKHIKESQLDPNVYSPYGSQDEQIKDFQQSYLFIARPDEPYGMEGLDAVAAGIPPLIPKSSCLAMFFKEHFADSVDYFLYDENNLKEFSDVIIRVIRNPKVVAKKTKELRQQLQNSKAITESHDKFLECCKKAAIRVHDNAGAPGTSTSSMSSDEGDAFPLQSSRKRKREQFPSFQATANLEFEERRIAVEERRVKMECTREESRVATEEKRIKLECYKEQDRLKQERERLELEEKEIVVRSKKRRLDEAWMLYEMEKEAILKGNDPDKIELIKQAFREYCLTVDKIEKGSLKFTLLTKSVDGLEKSVKGLDKFWQHCQNGNIEKKLTDILVTREIKKVADKEGFAGRIRLHVSKEDYRRVRKELLSALEESGKMTVSPVIKSPKIYKSPDIKHTLLRVTLSDIKNTRKCRPDEEVPIAEWVKT